MSTLYEISEDIINLIQQFEEAEGEMSEELSNSFEITKGELQQKAVAYYSVIQDNKASIEVYDNEIKRLQAKKKKANNLIDNLNKRLLGAVDLFGDFEAGTHTFKTRKSTSVYIDDENHISAEYIKTKEVVSIDKKLIKEHLKAGEYVPGASLQTNLNLKID